MINRLSGGLLGLPFSGWAALVAVLLVVIQPGTRAALSTNLARIFEIRASERPLRLLKMDANRATALVLSQHLEHELFEPSELRSLGVARHFARFSEAISPDARNALVAARLDALGGDHGEALKALAGPPPADLAGPWTVLVAALHERIGTRAAWDDWSIEGDASASYFLDLSGYLSGRGNLAAADESLRRAISYARSPVSRYVTNYRMALHKMYGLNQAEASLPYFSDAEALHTLVPPMVEDASGFHLSYGHALLNARRFPDAVAHASRAAALNPQDPHALEVLGRAHLDGGNLLEAKQAYTASIHLYQAAHLPIPGYTYFGMAQTVFALGDRPLAKVMFGRAIDQGVPDDLRTYIVGLLAGFDDAHGR